MKSNKQVIINFIVSCLEKGEKRGQILGKVVKKWESSRTTFDRMLKTAKDQHEKSLDLIKQVKQEVDITEARKERKRQIATAQERKEVLTMILTGKLKLQKPIVIGGKIRMRTFVPDWNDRKQAIAELNKMEGDYAPDKVANVKADGSDPDPVVQKFDDNQFDKIISLLNGPTETNQS